MRWSADFKYVILSTLLSSPTNIQYRVWSLICCVIEVVVEIIHYYHLRYRLLPILLQAEAPQVHGSPRQSSLRSVPRTAPYPNCTQYPWLWALSPSYSTYMKSPRFPPSAYNNDPLSKAEDGFSGIEPGTRFVEAKPAFAQKPRPFALQAPPTKALKTPQNTEAPKAEAPKAEAPKAEAPKAEAPKTPQKTAFVAPPPAQKTAFAVPPPPAAYGPARQTRTEPAPMAAGEKQYDAVPIPGAYAAASPPPQQQTFGFTGLPGQAVTAERRVDSPPLRRAGSR